MSREFLDRHPLTTQQTLAEVAAHFGMTLGDLRPDSRQKTQTAIRAIVAWTLRKRYEFSYPELAFMLHQNHTTIMHNVRKLDAAIQAGEDSQIVRVAQRVLLGLVDRAAE
jgi:chromosomal replication initiation ATPase DnaA